MRLLLPSLCAAFATLLPAQDVAPDFAARARSALGKTAATANTAFGLRWGPEGAATPPEQGGATRQVGPPIAGVRGAFRGVWAADRLHLTAEDEQGDEFVLAGRRMIARDATRPWCLRKARHADGSPATFLPDVPALLAFLAEQDLAVVCRDVGAVDDRPVEIFGTTLNAEQTAEAAWAGLLPDHWTQNAQRLNLAAIRAAPGGARNAPAAPTNLVDVAVHFEPATGVVHRVRIRSWSKQEVVRGNAVAMRINAEGRPERVDPDEAAADEAAAAKEAEGPPRFAEGMPVRPRRAALVHEIVVDLAGHGATDAPALDPEQQRLLGR